MTYRLKVKGRTYSCETLKDCSKIFCAMRDQSGEGASTFPDGRIFENGKRIARVSYNGRVWAGAKYDANATPIYDNRYDPAEQVAS